MDHYLCPTLLYNFNPHGKAEFTLRADIENSAQNCYKYYNVDPEDIESDSYSKYYDHLFGALIEISSKVGDSKMVIFLDENETDEFIVAWNVEGQYFELDSFLSCHEALLAVQKYMQSPKAKEDLAKQF